VSVTVDRRVKPFSAGLAAVVVGAVGLVAAATSGLRVAGLAALALSGAAVFVRGVTLGTAAPDGTTYRELAVASLTMAVGLLLALLPVFRFFPGTAAVVYAFVLAAAFAGVGSTSAAVGERAGRLRELCWRSRDVLGLAAAVSVLIHTGVVSDAVVTTVGLGTELVSRNAMVSLLALEGLAAVLLVALPAAQRILDQAVGTLEARRIAGVTVDGRRLDEILPAVRRQLRWFWWVVAVQVVLVVLFPDRLDTALARVPVLGPAAGVVTSGLLHLAVGGLAAAAVVVVIISESRSLVVWWAEVDPPRVLASATGGVVLSAAVLVSGHLLAGPAADLLFAETELAELATAIGPAALVLTALAAATFLVPFVLVFANLPVATISVATERSSAFGVSAVLGFAGTVTAAVQGVPAVVVFAGVAASLLTWKLGHQATYLGVQVGSDVRTSQTELVHAAAAVAVGIAGVALASLASYVLGPIGVPPGTTRAFVALMLALVAALSFVLALHYRQ